MPTASLLEALTAILWARLMATLFVSRELVVESDCNFVAETDGELVGNTDGRALVSL